MENPTLSDFELAIIDSIKTIIEVLGAKDVARPKEFARLYQHQALECVKNQNVAGAGVFELLADFCATRGALHALYKDPPSGSA